MEFFRENLLQILKSLGAEQQLQEGSLAGLLIILIVTLLGYLLARMVMVPSLHKLILASKTDWDDHLIANKTLEKLAIVVFWGVAYITLPILYVDSNPFESLLAKVLELLIVIQLTRVVFSLLTAINDIADSDPVGKKLPIKSVVQLTKLFLFFVSAILVISLLTNKSPIYFLSGLGVATGLVLLIFKDTILGFVAGVQLTANAMVSRGDWIEMPKYGADGEVEEVTLTTVKVRNWDKTVSMIPAYALVSDAFKNWQGMTQAGGRRIKRAVHIDISSVCFLDAQWLQQLKGNPLLTRYLDDKIQELELQQSDPRRRRLTNLGTFRAYLVNYLKANPNIRQDMTFIVRQLPSSELGVPLEIYVFCNDIRWPQYEAIQADIFDHIFAVLPEFGLRAYQRPSDSSFKSMT
ncbi:mechanosensitive ion channel family protein [Paraferrimonas sp. SM1919]|uniref:mechanosensitive ion channel family protein n=1 Tax=Paraferrimonas sp. SM1919 TaxID=2662263 RepID=UPI0013D03722|nr:mechanosensitive ion channel family protein [Paraferrimonas sp. SM1919]